MFDAMEPQEDFITARARHSNKYHKLSNICMVAAIS